MATMQAIRTRIKSVTSTQQITKAMKMVAASKLRKVQGNMLALRQFSKLGRDMLFDLLDSDIELNSPFCIPRKEVKKVAYVVVVGIRGLCGMYNAAVLHLLTDLLSEEKREYDVIVCGKWGKEVFKHRGIPVAKMFDELSDTPDQVECFEISDYLCESFFKGIYDEVHIVYQKYVSALTQTPEDHLYLPKVSKSVKKDFGYYKEPGYLNMYDYNEVYTPGLAGRGFKENFLSEVKDEAGYFFEPDRDAFVDSFMKLYLAKKLQQILLEAKCSEHSARVQAMTSASDNTEKLIAKLQLNYNRARQAAITTEISEIVGGASALKKKRSN